MSAATSLFRAQPWWQIPAGKDGFDAGSLCLLSGLCGTDEGSQVVAVGSLSGMLRLYAPQPEGPRAEDLVVEAQMEEAILQLVSARLERWVAGRRQSWVGSWGPHRGLFPTPLWQGLECKASGRSAPAIAGDFRTRRRGSHLTGWRGDHQHGAEATQTV